MKIFIIGKISGLLEEQCRIKFSIAETGLRSCGWDPVNPLKNGISPGTPLTEMLHYFESVSEEIQTLYLLKDWEDSLEARLIRSVAVRKGLDIYREDWHPVEKMGKSI